MFGSDGRVLGIFNLLPQLGPCLEASTLQMASTRLELMELEIPWWFFGQFQVLLDDHNLKCPIWGFPKIGVPLVIIQF